MWSGKRQAGRKERSLLPGAVAFLGIVVYVNLRSDHVMTVVDWAVIAFGVVLLGFALVQRYRDRG